jgi:DNA-binding transcriptional regulator YbjK
LLVIFVSYAPLMAEDPVRRYRKGEERVREILAATVDLIYEEGISAVSHRAVAKRANVADSAPSYFFPSIDDLIVEAFRSIMNLMIRDLLALSTRIEEEDMDRETAVDEYLKLTIENAPKHDKVQFEAYLFATRRPALKPEVDAAISATQRAGSTLVTASRRRDLDWAAPILTAYADGVGLHRIASPPDGIGIDALKIGLLALMESLPGKDPEQAKRSAKGKAHSGGTTATANRQL